MSHHQQSIPPSFQPHVLTPRTESSLSPGRDHEVLFTAPNSDNPKDTSDNDDDHQYPATPSPLPPQRPLQLPHSDPNPTKPNHLFSTPFKRKAASIPLSILALPHPGHLHGDLGSSESKRQRRFGKLVSPLIHEELAGAKYICTDFVQVFLSEPSTSPQPGAPTDSLLHGLLQAMVGSLLRSDGLRYNRSEDYYTCHPPSYTNRSYPEWFCRFANAIHTTAIALDTATLTPTLPPAAAPLPHSELKWLVTDSSTLGGTNNNGIKPDFILTCCPGIPTWSSVLVVGEHQSQGSTSSTNKSSFTQLACYAEQVFIAQPFRNFVFGILTSNQAPELIFWRFDRGGAIGSLTLNYRSTNLQLLDVVRALYSIPRLSPMALGFHVTSISWTPDHRYPLDAASGILTRVSARLGHTPGIHTEALLPLHTVVFAAPGIVSRGTRVWASLLDNGQSVIVKYSWRNMQRMPEGEFYRVAAEKRVVGIATAIGYDTYENIATSRHGEGDVSHIFTQPDKYVKHIEEHNRIFARLVLSSTGLPLSDPTLTPIQVARGLLAGLVGHASLFFQANLLHRDISPNNIIVTSTTMSPPGPATPTVDNEAAPFQWIWPQERASNLGGCLIDLDYAVDTTEEPLSGAVDRTGTYPFIAIKILAGAERHRYRHDLESFLYVLLWVCCYPVRISTTTSPTTTIIESVQHNSTKFSSLLWPSDDPLYIWQNGDQRTVVSDKIANIVSDTQNFECLLNRFRPGFEPFKVVARCMRRTLWGFAGTSFCGLVGEGDEELPSNEREWVLAGEVRIGVSNRDGFCEVKKAFLRLITMLENDTQGKGK
ncbi:hypothetical protein L211DRAFT_871918 [Terfezia boudieri ATCC MYA-4762]|uniref:non-specific serine/threonine protein kinase n=1 Tax=Terfezia boudieri ATCC MYA-4762 TaxID=1051890 RepID=A0A3N4LJG0_9PEZI|nr:hypothetical protein L211DRAFT_871918 [Terfezia boudieri ATCC MYA-4762]